MLSFQLLEPSILPSQVAMTSMNSLIFIKEQRQRNQISKTKLWMGDRYLVFIYNSKKWPNTESSCINVHGITCTATFLSVIFC